MDFTHVNDLTLPGGASVKFIADSQGRFLWKKSRLPAGYIELDCIESTATQYLNLGIKGNQSTKVELDYCYVQGFTNSRLFGARSGENNKSFFVSFQSSANGNFYFDIGNKGYFDKSGLDYSRNKWLYNENGKVYKNNILWHDFGSISSFETVDNLLLFGAYVGTTINQTKAKIYSCKIWKESILVRNLVPCVNPQGKVGMYDTVSQSFFGNEGTGEFIPHYKLPSYLQQVEDLESTGEQWIDTRVVPYNKTKAIVGYHLTYATPTSANPIVVLSGGNTDDNARFYLQWNSSSLSGLGNSYSTIHKKLGCDLDRHSYIIDAKNKIWKIDDTDIDATTGNKTFTNSVNSAEIFLFAFNSLASGTATRLSKLKISNCIFCDNDVLIRNLIPCYFKITVQAIDGNTGVLTTYQQGKPCMYDIVNDRIYVNQGTGADFIVGPDVN